jgi:hypothetical protein
MRESPLPGFAGEAGLVLDGRVVVAIAKCMAMVELSPEGKLNQAPEEGLLPSALLVLRSDPELSQVVIEVLGSEARPKRARHRSEKRMLGPLALITARAK